MLRKEDFAVIKALKKRDVYVKDIAAELGVHPKTVSRALRLGSPRSTPRQLSSSCVRSEAEGASSSKPDPQIRLNCPARLGIGTKGSEFGNEMPETVAKVLPECRGDLGVSKNPERLISIVSIQREHKPLHVDIVSN